MAESGADMLTKVMPFDTLNGLGALFGIFAALPVWRGAGVAYAVFVLIDILPAVAALSAISGAVAQSRRPQSPAIEQATRALNEGHYDRVAGLLEKLDAQDPAVVALMARAEIARGQYQQAETALRPAAQRAPT